MALNRELRSLARALLFTFALVALAAAYWASVERDRLLEREDNPRLLAERASIQRGAIYDRLDTLLVRTQHQASGGTDQTPSLVREYLLPEFYGALGYFSLTYGTGGIENLHDRPLAGADRPRTLDQIVFEAPIEGSDIRLTLDARIQRVLYDSLRDRIGAGVVIGIPSGDVLAQISNPTYNPNTLDADWAGLLAAPGNPFFNRAVQGRYQPGGLVQTPLIALIERNGLALDTPRTGAAAPVRLDTLVLTCAAQPPSATLSLQESYQFGCPAPFLTLGESFQPSLVLRALQQLNASRGVSESAVPPEFDPESSEALRNLLLGQGTQVVSPLDIALFAAAIVNDGNAPQPRTLLAVRSPETAAWQMTAVTLPSLPIMTSDTASRLEQLMEQSMGSQGEAVIGVHTAVAYSGESTLVWFMGFARTASGESVAAAIVLENSRSIDEILAIGLSVLRSAAEHASPSATVP